MLFVGESPPASGRFFYNADSGRYCAIRQTLLSAFPDLKDADFLESFRQLDYYLVDFCGSPVDRLTGNSAGSRARRAKRDSAQSFGGSILKLWSRSSVPSEPKSNARRLARSGKAPISNCCIRAAGRRTGLHSNELSGPLLRNLRRLDRMTSASVVPTLRKPRSVGQPQSRCKEGPASVGDGSVIPALSAVFHNGNSKTTGAN
jgi:hypothetical protein